MTTNASKGIREAASEYLAHPVALIRHLDLYDKGPAIRAEMERQAGTRALFIPRCSDACWVCRRG